MKKLLSLLIAMLMALIAPTPDVQPTDTADIETLAASVFSEPVSETVQTADRTELHQPVLLNHNTLQTSTRFSVSENGTARVYIDYTGYRGITTDAVIKITLEKEDGTRVHTDTVTAEGEYYQNTLSYPLTEAGVYRCTVVYTVSGIGGKDDVITFEDIKEYIPKKENDENFEYAGPEPAAPGTVLPDVPVSLSANALTKHIDLGGSLAFIHSEQGYIANDDLFGERYVSGDRCGIYTYEPNGKASYLACKNKYCSHTDCGAVTAGGYLFSIGNILYRVENGNIYSRLSDGEWRIEWQSDGGAINIGSKGAIPLYSTNWHNILPYGPFIYITAYGENGEAHILKYDTHTKTMDDITSYTGAFIHYEFAYDGYLYGYNENRTEFIRQEIYFSGQGESVPDAVKEVFAQDFRIHLTQNSLFIGVLYDENGESLGIMTFDMEKQEKNFISNEDLGQNVLSVIGADDTYYYFLDKNCRGNIYRVRHDGSGVSAVYESADMNICAYQMLIFDDSILVYAQKVGEIGGKQRNYADGWYIGSLDENGKIESLTWLEAVQ